MQDTAIQSFAVGDRVTVSGSVYRIARDRYDQPSPGASTWGWFQCVQETGHPAVVGTIQYLSPSMLSSGSLWTPKLD